MFKIKGALYLSNVSIFHKSDCKYMLEEYSSYSGSVLCMCTCMCACD